MENREQLVEHEIAGHPVEVRDDVELFLAYLADEANNGVLYCKFCSKTVIKSKWDKHMSTYHVDESETQFSCPAKDCNAYLSKIDRRKTIVNKSIANHIWNAHLLGGRMVFQLDTNKYKNHYMYLYFLQTIVNEMDTADRYYCKSCDEFIDQEELGNHLQTEHQTTEAECSYIDCAEKFPYESLQEIFRHFKVI
jgi:hypothetical protein